MSWWNRMSGHKRTVIVFLVLWLGTALIFGVAFERISSNEEKIAELERQANTRSVTADIATCEYILAHIRRTPIHEQSGECSRFAHRPNVYKP